MADEERDVRPQRLRLDGVEEPGERRPRRVEPEGGEVGGEHRPAGGCQRRERVAAVARELGREALAQVADRALRRGTRSRPSARADRRTRAATTCPVASMTVATSSSTTAPKVADGDDPVAGDRRRPPGGPADAGPVDEQAAAEQEVEGHVPIVPGGARTRRAGEPGRRGRRIRPRRSPRSRRGTRRVAGAAASASPGRPARRPGTSGPTPR